MSVHIRKIVTTILFVILLISSSFYYYYLYLSGNGVADKSDPLFQYKYQSWDDYCKYYDMDCGLLNQRAVTVLGDGFIYDDKAYYLFSERVPYSTNNERDQAYQEYLEQYIQKPFFEARYNYQVSDIDKILDWDGNMAMINDRFYVRSTSYYGTKDTPRILSSNLFRDSRKIFFNNNLSTLFISDVDFVDPRTFEVLDVKALYTKDKNRAYYSLKIVSGADATSFVVHPKNINFAYDDFSVFYQNYLIQSADVKTFDVLSDQFSKDENNVYIENMKVEGADPKTFEIINEKYAKDHVNYYCLPLIGQKETEYSDRKPIAAVGNLEFDFSCFEPQA